MKAKFYATLAAALIVLGTSNLSVWAGAVYLENGAEDQSGSGSNGGDNGGNSSGGEDHPSNASNGGSSSSDNKGNNSGGEDHSSSAGNGGSSGGGDFSQAGYAGSGGSSGSVAAVPETSTWVMGVLALGSVIFMVRRKRRLTTRIV
ncbi:MAG: hypothetical protein WCO94_04145 [Verrucomicrobiota bacterium]